MKIRNVTQKLHIYWDEWRRKEKGFFKRYLRKKFIRARKKEMDSWSPVLDDLANQYR